MKLVEYTDEWYDLLDEIRNEYDANFQPKEKTGVPYLKRMIDWYKKKDIKRGKNYMNKQEKPKETSNTIQDYIDSDMENVESTDPNDYTITDAGEIELKTEDLDIEGLPEKYSNVLLKLYAEGYICDINNVDDELKQELIDNGYEDDYVISFEEQDGLYVVTIPFAYGSPELRVSTNNLCFYDNYVRICDEYTDVTEYPIFIDDTNIDEEASHEEGWININNIDEIKDTMSNMGI